MHTVSDHSPGCTIYTEQLMNAAQKMRRSQNIDDIDPRYIYHIRCGQHKR